MKQYLNIGILCLVIGLVSANIIVFVHGIELAEEIRTHESGIQKLRVENNKLSQELFSMNSHTKTASHAAVLGYGHYRDPVYIELGTYARN